ncbi:uncharacterized protein TrAtP1_001123 [Trichoderma atroviride]|uniref:Uncharacterized protein n=1 Tax=Hypocrea atroviridis (strain ATCC 20476 / IMI 206040) TaxID=452589 RepID=G9NDW8_HYPAI|nr:uncharacterized protein TRIATDRAFT_303124 [Trichoderma atroviride IMI 206040]EHK51151.1 hypothetical protein TRIATDRAFT_303124 [Trichoderma atroviride IMI 206040]UKZ59832.1 hypothetical protein TrAtP1_001123 [Trichoderma atroviride]
MDSETVEPRIPDVQAAATAFRTIAEQLDACSQYTEFPSPNYNETRLHAIVDESLASVQNNVNANTERILRSIAELRSEFYAAIQAVNTRVSSSRRNDVARSFNSTINRDNSVLAPLYNVETGELITSFPHTIHDISQLPINEVNDFLHQLDIVSTGNLVSRQRQLMLAYGVVL